MPKIPTFESQARPTAEVGGIKTGFQVPVTADFISKAQTGIANYYVSQQQEEAKLKSLDYENKAYVGLFDLHDKWKNHPLPSEAADGFQKESKDYISRYLEDNLSGENNFVKRATQQKLNAALSTLNLSVLNKSRDSFEKSKLKEENNFENIILTKVQTIDGYAESGLASNEIANYVNTNISDPNADISVNKKKTKFESMMSKVNTVSMEKDSLKPDFLTKLKEDPSLYPGVPTNERVKIIAHAQANQEKIKAESIQSWGRATVAGSKFNEGADTVALLIPEINKQFADPEIRDKVIKAVKDEEIKRKKTFVDSGAAEYYMNASPNLSQEYSLALQDPKKMPQFKQSMDLIYNEKNTPEQYRTYVPNNKVVEIVDTLKGTKNADEKLKTIQNLNAVYGSDVMPSLSKQLVKAGLPTDIQIVMSTNSESLKKDILSSASTKDLEEQAKKIVSASEFKAIEKEIYNKTKGYQEIILQQKNGSRDKTELLLSMEKTFYNAVLNKVVNNKITPANAVKEVTDQFLADYDLTQKTYFIPKDIGGIPVNKEAVKDKADAILLSLEKSNYLENFHGKDGFGHYGTLAGFQNALPENIKMSTKETFDSYVKEKMISSMKKHSKWLLNSDSTGIVMYVDLANGSIPITNAKGEKIEFLFADIPNKNPKIKSIDMVEPGTGKPLLLFQDSDLLRETNY
jgi:hypothetical protein